ncbi:hypothetical protein TanjilG_14186 [Lupinus angustifolius]|uniref:Uncharacterized protein n=1 Tax=Lupinus angustifolius TaxID=3871 RepID=A0A1J7IGG2_LUPAN|nr:hypothetical protein TanjilG_14186 [Lupinus angustifolius]
MMHHGWSGLAPWLVKIGAPMLDVSDAWCLGQKVCAKACVLRSEYCVEAQADALMAIHCGAWVPHFISHKS